MGESTFCIASLPARKGYIECTFRQTGKVTSVLAEKGDVVGFRGRYGNTFPLNKWKGKNLLFRAGGIALTAKGFVIRDAHDTHEKFKAIIIIYGAKSGEDLVYKDEIAEWRSCLDLKLVTTVDPGGETPD
ncbi:MAG TPA: hypothetical protein VFC67_01335 [Prolixibacteraceae bacterium]|nr:hypothetical protein [Prolixibacteraceae bacterium]